MPARTTALTEDQAEDLRELLGYVAILEDWLLHAPDETISELADAAYHGHFHPYSAAWWLIEDIGHLGSRLRKALPGRHPGQARPAAAPGVTAGPEAETRTTPSSPDGLDTPSSIGNQNGARHAGRQGKLPRTAAHCRPAFSGRRQAVQAHRRRPVLATERNRERPRHPCRN